MRASGILLPISSLPSKYGIGTFSKSAYGFIDILKEAGQRYWQILPLGPTGYGDSPYQSFSTFAGNPYFIDLEALIEEGYLTVSECEAYDVGSNPSYVDYEKIYLSRFEILRKAYERSNIREVDSFKKFKEKNAFWLKDYALYMAVKNHFKGKSFLFWDDDIKCREQSAIDRYTKMYSDEIEFNEYIQYMFTKQWESLKEYANKNDIKIIGDIPIYVAFDSADTWANPHLFQLDENRNPVAVSGCPPDAFSPTGQLWGNPLYNWEVHRQEGYSWWITRIAFCLNLYDMLRVDHFRGFDEYYSIPYGDTTAENGHWIKGPGNELFQALHNELGNDINIIAEDLGFMTESVKELLKDTGYPGMKVLEFAFDSRDDSDHLPHNYVRNSIVYTGTHDNDTIHGWYQSISREDKEFAKEYLNNYNTKRKDIHWDYIRLASGSVAKLCIIPIQDYLGLGREARINTPSTLGDNWKWRMTKGQITPEIVEKIREITRIYGRL